MQADKAAAGVPPPLVAQGVTAKPDIHPFFYAPLPALIADSCEWLKESSIPSTNLAVLDALFEHGVESGLGWASAQGYCA